MRIFSQQPFGGHDHSRGAEAALCPEVFVEGTLQPRQIAFVRETLDGLDTAPCDAVRQRTAGQPRFAIDEYGTRAALPASIQLTTYFPQQHLRAAVH